MKPREAEARTELLEAFADFDDALPEELIEDQEILTQAIYDVATQTLQRCDLIPAFLGAAEHCNGVMRMMKSLRHEASPVEQALARISPGGRVVAVGCMGELVKHLGKSVLLRAMNATCSSGSEVAALGGLTMVSRSGNGSLQMGDLGRVVKSDHLRLGQVYLKDGARALPAWAPPRPATYRRVITPLHQRDDTRLSTVLDRMVEVDPAMEVEQDEATGHALLNLQGPQHLRRVMETLKGEFGVEVEPTQVPPALRETITKPVEIHHRHRKQSGGAGQFSDVVLEIKPLSRNGGVSFEQCVKGGSVPNNYIPAVEQRARSLATGSKRLSDCRCDGHAEGWQTPFSRQFGFCLSHRRKNAVRDALTEAGLVLLQPIVKVAIHVPSVFSGNLVSMVSGMKGQILGFEAE